MILLFTPNQIASRNIAHRLIADHGFAKKEGKTWEREGIRLIETDAPTVLDVPTEFDTDCIIVLSPHRSKAEGSILTVHVPGNWKNADFGGEPRTLNIAAASRVKILAQEISKEAEKISWKFALEVDHHGPTCSVPIIFVEIGNGEEQWKDENAAAAMANAVSAAIRRNENYEAVFGAGGGHYAKDFTRIVLETELAVGHIAAKYVLDDLDEEMFMQGIEKNVEKISKVLILKKETNSSQKKKLFAFAEKAGVPYELV